MKKGDRSGWSLVEIAIVVTIIGLLAALAIPLFTVLTKRSRVSALANDLRTHGQAILTYAMTEDDFPADFASPTIPTYPDGKPVLGPAWKFASPVGGSYSWHYTNAGNPKGSSGFIQIAETSAAPFTVGLSDVRKLDEKMDDGNLGSGYLQMAGARIRYYVKVPTP
jgi:prepilin-type N-terminal cleavage/methylation domain-containing protein